MEVFVLFWLVFGLVVAMAARERGHNPATWFLVAVLISPLVALILLALSKPGEGIPGHGPRKACPQCGEGVPVEAKLCRYCRHEFPEDEVVRAVAAARPRRWTTAQRAVFYGIIGSGLLLVVLMLVNM